MLRPPQTNFESSLDNGITYRRGLKSEKSCYRSCAIFRIEDHFDKPLRIGADKAALFYFEKMLFMSERPPSNEEECEEFALRIKKICFQQREELVSLKSIAANYEAALTYRQSGSRREPIPDDVKMVVWARDGETCVRCGMKQQLHFDHMIPVSKGGANSEENIQLLCQTCNLKKSDKIVF
jgi:hypothetical protein